MVDGKEITGAKEDGMAQVCAGQITFTTDGKLDTQTQTMSAYNFKGGAQQNQQVVLLHCVSSYPAAPDELNLKSVQFLRDRFGVLWSIIHERPRS